MKYTKTLLNKTKNPAEYLERGEIYESLNNEKTLEELTEVVLKNLKGIDGDVYILRKEDEKLKLIVEREDKEDIETKVENSLVYKKLKETKKPFLDDRDDEIYAGFPLNFKGRLIGCLVIEKKQKINCWEELYEYLNMLVFAFRFYKLLEKERESNIKDSITGLFNERYFRNHLEIEEEKFIRKQIPVSLLLIEIHNIEEISDTLGYEFEEKILKKIAKVIKMQSRKVDMPAKVNRGTFGILLSYTVEQGAEVMMKRIQEFIEDELEYRNKKVKADIRYAINEIKTGQTREIFYNETVDKLK